MLKSSLGFDRCLRGRENMLSCVQIEDMGKQLEEACYANNPALESNHGFGKFVNSHRRAKCPADHWRRNGAQQL
jgi:hypothetical protein